MKKSFKKFKGEYFISKYSDNNAYQNGFRFLDYYPLINQRIHVLGKNKKILNDKFKQQYLKFLRILAEKPQLSLADELWSVYYLLLQDKIELAIQKFDKIATNSSNGN